MDDEFKKLLAQNMSDSMDNSVQYKEKQDFQDTISATMNKLKSSSLTANAQSTNAADFEDASMESMMKELELMMETGDFDDAFGGILGELVTKDLLNEPMKELMQKYPQWLKDNKGKITDEEHSRYTNQYEVVEKIVAVFEKSSSPDLTEEETKVVMDLMQEVKKFN